MLSDCAVAATVKIRILPAKKNWILLAKKGVWLGLVQ